MLSCTPGPVLTAAALTLILTAPAPGQAPAAPAAVEAAHSDRVLNPGAELSDRDRGLRDAGGHLRPAGWNFGPLDGGATFSWASTEDGGRCLEVRCDDPAALSRHGWGQEIDLWKQPPVGGSARLELSAVVRAQGLHPMAQAFARALLVSGDGRVLGSVRTECVTRDGGWRRIEAVFALPQGTRSIHLTLELEGKGRVWFDEIELADTDRPPRSAAGTPPAGGYERLARECAREIPWTFDREAAQARARAEDRPLLVYVRCIDAESGLRSAQTSLAAREVSLTDDGLRKDLLMRAGPWSDPDLCELVRRRFVPLIVTYDLSRHGLGGAPDDPLSPLGLTASETVTPAVVLFDSEGRLVHRLDRIGTLSAPFVDRLLRDALFEMRASLPAPVRDWDAEPLELYLAGELAAALAVLGERGDREARLLRARTLMRMGEVEAAATELEGLEGPEAGLRRARLALARGRPQAALAELAEVRFPAGHPFSEEARFWEAWALWRAGLREDAREEFDRLVGPTRFGRKAAACLLPEGPYLTQAETARFFEPGPSLPTTTEGIGADESFDVERAIEFLLGQQHSDGSFGGHLGAPGVGPWDPSITAIAGEALLSWRAQLPTDLRARANLALAGAQHFLEQWARRPGPEAGSRLDAFNHPYVLFFLLQVSADEAVRRVVARVLASQLPDHTWSVYGPGRPTSFVSALNLLALSRAREAGFAMPEAALERGRVALEAMRSPGGPFPYSTRAGHGWMTTEHGSIARDLLCESALTALGGEVSRRRVERAFERFVAHQGELRAPTKQLYDYFDERGHGGYHFFFAWRNAVDAAPHLPQRRRAQLTELLRENLLAAREFDGTWIDQAMLGRVYGTAMALYLLARD